jgi:hypothetical protein
MLAFLTGRKTGRHYRQPISYVRDGETLLTPGGGRWKLNLSEDRPVRLRLRGHDIQALPEIVGDVEEVDRLLGVMIDGNPMVKRFVAVPQTADGHFDRDRLQTAIRYGFRIIRWRPQPTGAAQMP